MAVFSLAGGPFPAAAQEPCRFVLGFAQLREIVGSEIVGDCLVNERHNPANGNTEQRTTNGLLVWRRVDHWTAFTDGYRTWVSGPDDVQQRLNTERFFWEHDPITPVESPLPPLPPAPTATTTMPPPTSPAATPPPAAPAPTPAGDTAVPAIPPEAQPAVDAALRDAAARLAVPREQLRVMRVEAVEWSDSSLGCPQPGMFYLQVITPGYLVVVASPGGQLEYHTDTRGRAVFCRTL
ncbi:MAG: hypothetical protein HY332_09585 [Chloroflexi bacterium]|nr:hypothetical protein [Chloroflexota bacterium]